jgi:AhpD family alkylhydroperoxidase
MPLIDPVQNPDPHQQQLLAKSLPGPDGQPLNIFRTLVRLPELMRRTNALGGYFFVAGQLPLRVRELVILRTAGRAKCAYEASQHRWLGAEAGLTAEETNAALDPSIPHGWSDAESRLLDFVDELLASDVVSPDSWNLLESDFSETERLELLVLVGYYRMLAGVLNTLGVEVDSSVAKVNRSS